MNAFRVEVYLFTLRRVEVQAINQREIRTDKRMMNVREEKKHLVISSLSSTVRCCSEDLCCRPQTQHTTPTDSLTKHYMTLVTCLLYYPLFSG